MYSIRFSTSDEGTVGIIPSDGDQAYVADTGSGRVYSFPKQSSACMAEKLSAKWRFFFFEKIINQNARLTEREAICINRLFTSVKDETQARDLITSIKEKGYEKKMIEAITNIRSSVFSNVANGLSWLYYSQNKNTILEAGRNVDAENFYAWEPYGNVKENYEAVVSDPSLSTFFDWMYNSRTYTYTVHLEDDGRFRVHAIGTEFSHLGPSTYHNDFYIDPFETVSVYFGSKNKYVNIEDYTVVMPGVLFAWLIDQGERETNQMLTSIGITAVSFYLSGSSIAKAAGTAGKIVNSVLFVKGFSDLIINSNKPTVQDILGPSFIAAYKDVSKIIDCGIIFKEFADKEINSKVSLLVKAWAEVDDTAKEELKSNYSSVFNFIDAKINELNSNN